jgi:hypothetical protein
LRDKYGPPALPIVIYLKVGLNGIGIDSYNECLWDFEILKFNFLCVGLPGLNAVEYLQGDNWLGVALTSLMQIPPEQAANLGAEALRRLTEAPLTEQQRFLLADCVQAYLPLDEQQRREYEQIVIGESYSKVKTMNQTVFEQGIEKGLQNSLLRLGQRRFGPASKEIELRIRSIHDVDRLEALTDRILDAQNWDEFLAGM